MTTVVWKRHVNKICYAFMFKNARIDKLLKGKANLGKHHRCFINLVRLTLTDWCLTYWHLNYYNLQALPAFSCTQVAFTTFSFFFYFLYSEFKLAADTDDSQKHFVVHFKGKQYFPFGVLCSAKIMYKYGFTVQSGIWWETTEKQCSFMLVHCKL